MEMSDPGQGVRWGSLPWTYTLRGQLLYSYNDRDLAKAAKGGWGALLFLRPTPLYCCPTLLYYCSTPFIMLLYLFIAQLVGKARQLGCPKIVLDHVCVYLYILYVCALWVSSPLVVYDAIDNASSSRATRTEN